MDPNASLQIRCHAGVSEVHANQWNCLAGSDPFLSHAWLSALEASGCVGATAGWLPRILTAWDQENLVGAMPLYEKRHSWGEYVFDFAWADAYRRAGLAYYPKLVAAIPFTPVTGARLLSANAAVRRRLLKAARDLAEDLGASSLHLLFIPEESIADLPQDFLVRTGVQFHWQNQGWPDFEAFLGSMSHDKRKKIRQERRKIAATGVQVEWRPGGSLSAAEWQDFYRCYDTTYRLHGQRPYLNLDFFHRIGAVLADRTLLIMARRNTRLVAAALFLHSESALFGRWWGALEYIPGLHFELCYYQAIEYAIRQRLQRFEAGAQGEHKLARGLIPQPTYSAHWLAHPAFNHAVADYLAEEGDYLSRYIGELSERSPFKSPR